MSNQRKGQSNVFEVATDSPKASPQGCVAMLNSPGFGQVFSDHMVTMRWSEKSGWTDGKVVPRSPISLDPASSVFHYGQAIFEGYRAYTQASGGVASFRPYDHGKRFEESAKRLAMPPLPVDLFVAAGDALIAQDSDWIFSQPDYSFYLRPLMIATEAGLGVRASNEYLFLVIGSPSGPYFRGGAPTVSVWVTSDYSRSARGGTGRAKCAGNYGGSLSALAEAKAFGCDQVLWLDSAEKRFVEEMGAMNVFFFFRRGRNAVLSTPCLGSGTLLAGITRASIIELARDQGIAVEERQIELAEVLTSADDGTLLEAFACGTAAVIAPIGNLRCREGIRTINGNVPGPVAMQLRKRLTSIQWGTDKDPYGWMHQVF